MDLYKAFDTLNHDLLLAKLHAYGFDRDSPKVLHSCLSNRYKRTKINKSFSSWRKIVFGIPKGSGLGPLLFNIYINDLFYMTKLTDVCSFANDATFQACDSSLEDLVNRLEHDTKLAIEWFVCNYMKLNQDKCHIIISGHKSEAIWAKISQSKIWESKNQNLLGVIIDHQLNFDEYLVSPCKKAEKKLSVLARLANFLSLEERKLLMKSFIESQFGYCPLTWMFCGRKNNIRINHVHERALRRVYRNNSLCFDQLLQIDKSYNIHHKNIQTLTIELYKVKNNLSNQIMQEIFEKLKNIDYNLRFQTDFVLPGVNTT